MFTENQVLNNTYQIMYPIGAGGAGCVYLAYHLRLQKYIVVKQINSPGKQPSRNEADVLKSLHHPNLPQVYDYAEENGNVYTVMDYVEGADLQRYIDEGCVCSAEDIAKWYRQLADVLVYIHEHNPVVIHSDIKPSNIIITPQNDAVLIDFNISLGYGENSVLGLTYSYASPEQVYMAQQKNSGYEPDFILDGRSDIYSLAAAFYHLMTKKAPTPFEKNDRLSGSMTGYPEALLKVIDKSLEPDRQNRYQNAAQLKHDLDNMHKKETGYKVRVLLICIGICAACAILAVGLYSLINSDRENTANNFAAAYNRCIRLLNSEKYVQACEECMDTLNRYDTLLEENPKARTGLLKGAAVSLFETENFEQSAEYYMEAAAAAENESEMADCYSSAAAAYVYAGNEEKADEVIKTAEALNISGNSIRLIKLKRMEASAKSAGLSQRKETASYIASEAEDILSVCTDNKISFRVCITAAQASVYETEKYKWLERAAGYSHENGNIIAEGLRQSGHGFLELAVESSDKEIVARSLEKAAECYEALTASDDCIETDFINLSAACRLSGQYQKAIDALDTCAGKINQADMGVIYMEKALIYDEWGNASNASVCCENALKSGISEDSVSEAGWEKFTSIAEKYGISTP